MENIKTMNYQMYADWGDSETFEVSKYDDLETAIEQSIMIEENPSKYGIKRRVKAEIIRIANEHPSKWSTSLSIDGYVVVAVYEQ